MTTSTRPSCLRLSPQLQPIHQRRFLGGAGEHSKHGPHQTQRCLSALLPFHITPVGILEPPSGADGLTRGRQGSGNTAHASPAPARGPSTSEHRPAVSEESSLCVSPARSSWMKGRPCPKACGSGRCKSLARSVNVHQAPSLYQTLFQVPGVKCRQNGKKSSSSLS